MTQRERYCILMNRSQEVWYRQWFDTPYYSQLYAHRGSKEAEQFLSQLIKRWDMQPHTQVLDIPCGEGRYSRLLHQKGFHVVGLDINEALIKRAKAQDAGKDVIYGVHDMYKPYAQGVFDYVLMLFTSFGYFSTKKASMDTLISQGGALKEGGLFVLDYFNPTWVKKRLVGKEEKVLEGVHYVIRKHILSKEGAEILIKEIDLTDGEERRRYREQVMLFSAQDLATFFAAADMKVEAIYGSYDLGDYDENSSPRWIWVGRKGI